MSSSSLRHQNIKSCELGEKSYFWWSLEKEGEQSKDVSRDVCNVAL